MIINVARCSWLHLVPYMLKVNIPIWLYWGIPPAFGQPLNVGALDFAPSSHPQSRVSALSGTNVSQPVGLHIPSAHGGPNQLSGEMWKEFMVRQSLRRKTKLIIRCKKAMKKQPQTSPKVHKICKLMWPLQYIWNSFESIQGSVRDYKKSS